MSGNNPLPTGGGYAGPAWYLTHGSGFNAMAFLVRQIVAGKTFGALVKVIAVNGPGGVNPPGTVAVQPLVNQIDGLGNQVPHGTVFGMPWFRLQGGTSAIILDPKVGDIGAALICDRDISNVKANKATSGPGSWRQNDWADGLYFGSFLGETPTQGIEFADGGINIFTNGTIALSTDAGNVSITTAGTIVTSSGALTNNGANISNTHVHGGVVVGGGNTTGPH